MAEVYRARDRLLDRPVALKILFPELSVDRSFVERFRREAQAAANLSHPNIVPVFDWGEDGGTYFIVMEFIDGRTLSSILRTAGELHPDRAAEITADVAGALSYAHRHGVIHRDVKPGNVLITEEGVVKVTDFGIARALNTEESLTQTGAVMGTATYFSPEQAEGLGVDARSDIYSLGVVLFEMVTGRPPFLGESPVSVASKHVREHPPTPREINPSVPPDLEAIILKCMAKAPEYRYASGDDLRVDLLRFREGRAVEATIPPISIGTTQALGAAGRTATIPQVRGEPYEEPLRSRTALYVALLVLLLAALAAVVLFLGQSLGWWHLGRKATPTTLSLPNVNGESVTQATGTLERDGLKVVTQTDSSSNEPTTQVIRTDPASGSKVKKGATVTLVTGGKTASTQITVPSNLVGQSVQDATSELSSMKLFSTVQPTAGCIQLNVVCRTSPTGGQPITAGGTVTLFTAQTTTTTSTPSSINVPGVTGDSVTQACDRIDSAGLSCGTQATQYSSTYPQGEVSSTSPSQGTPLAPGATVNLVVSEGPPPTVPSVTGDTFGQAKSQLESDGLAGVSDGTCSSDSDPMSAEVPSAGSTAPNNGEVTLSCTSTPTTTTTTGVVLGNHPGGGGGPGAGGPGAGGAAAAVGPGSRRPRRGLTASPSGCSWI
jgi:eukaryotic-like serine/threonine-protein kinase